MKPMAQKSVRIALTTCFPSIARKTGKKEGASSVHLMEPILSHQTILLSRKKETFLGILHYIFLKIHDFAVPVLS